MANKSASIRIIARVCADGEFNEEAIVERLSDRLCFGKKPRWVRPLAKSLSRKFCGVRPPREKAIIGEIPNSEAFQNAWLKGKVEVGTPVLEVPPVMHPAPGAPQTWRVPPATTLSELAALLRMHVDDLGWITSHDRTVHHYLYQWHRKRNSPAKRLIEIPKPLLKEAQSAVLSNILTTVPTHEAACAFQVGKSVFDFVKPHTGHELAIKIDLKDFFPSVRSGRVFRLFQTLGYSEIIASTLARLCTNAVPTSVLADESLPFAERRKYRNRHLPQGAPGSPALANLCAFRLDCRLSGLAGSVDANYTRYADDLLFSGDHQFARRRERFHLAVLKIILEEGFEINPRKTRFMHHSQRQIAAGLVFNEKPGVSRREYDQLKAILTNCQRNGWQSQNRDSHPEFQAHLAGRIQWINASNPARGKKLKAIFEAITW